MDLTKREWEDYREIVLAVRSAAILHVVVESALRIAVTENTVVRFKFNDTEFVVDPAAIRNDLIREYIEDRGDGAQPNDAAQDGAR